MVSPLHFPTPGTLLSLIGTTSSIFRALRQSSILSLLCPFDTIHFSPVRSRKGGSPESDNCDRFVLLSDTDKALIPPVQPTDDALSDLLR